MEKKKNTPFWDASLSIEERLDWLMSAMTIEEKLSCLSTTVPDLERLGIPVMAVGGEAAHGVEARNDQNELGEAETTTSFPQPIGMSATWNRALIRQAGAVTGTETRVIYHRHPDRGLVRFAPTIDLERDPRWGRNEEGYGEDPFLIGEMASSYIRGMQGDDPCYLRMAATLKHFYGNNTEEGRGWKSASIDPRNKYELYLEPFRRAIVKGGAEAVMTAYNKINGIPGILNSEVEKILKRQYGLKSAVCDGGAMALVATFHHYYGTNAETLANAIKAGVDAMTDSPAIVKQAAEEAYELGLLTEEELDHALKNMFRTRLRLGIYDAVSRNPYDAVTEEDINSAENQKICRQVSRESVVLLKNENNMLPLDSAYGAGDIALIGPLGDAWYQDWYGGKAYAKSTLRQGIEKILGKGIAFADGLDRVVFRCGDMGIAVRPDGTLGLEKEPDVFIKEDWGEGCLTFRCVRTGKYMNTRMYLEPEEACELGRIAAEKDSTFDWFVMEIFHLEEQGDGTVILTNRFDFPVSVREDGSLWSMQNGEQVGPTVGIDLEIVSSDTASLNNREKVQAARFTVEVVKSGIEEAVKLAESSRIVLLALGCNSMIPKEEVDRSTIALPKSQEALLKAVYQANPNAVLTLFSNYPYAIGMAEEKLPAVLWSATGSQDMGIAMAETIFGLNAPAGRLNMTWYQSDDQLPDIDDYDIIKGKRTYRYFDGEVLYPFGHGLTYSDFIYSDLSVELIDKTKLQAAFTVKNTGNRVSDEVVQVYGKAPASRVKKPLKQLVGFERLKDVRPGESRRAVIEVPVEEFRFYDVISRSLMVEEGEYTICAGASSADLRLTERIKLPGGKTGLRNMEKKISADHYDDYENIILTEGQFGFSAVTLPEKEQEGILYFRDCLIEEGATDAFFHLMSEKGGSLELLIDKKTVGKWQGDTRTYVQTPHPQMGGRMAKEAGERIKIWKPVYADVRVALAQDEKARQTQAIRPAEVEIRISGDIKLCYFRFGRK